MSGAVALLVSSCLALSALFPRAALPGIDRQLIDQVVESQPLVSCYHSIVLLPVEMVHRLFGGETAGADDASRGAGRRSADSAPQPVTVPGEYGVSSGGKLSSDRGGGGTVSPAAVPLRGFALPGAAVPGTSAAHAPPGRTCLPAFILAFIVVLRRTGLPASVYTSVFIPYYGKPRPFAGQGFFLSEGVS